jgi:hypothetical protein
MTQQPEQPKFKVYVGAYGDFLRDRAGEIIFWNEFKDAETVAQKERGFVLPADAGYPGGFDPARTF